MKDKLSWKVKAGYGLGQFGEGIAYNFFYYFYTYFLVSLVGFNPATAGSLSAFAVIWDAVTDPIVGHFSDKCKSGEGKRRAFIAKAAIPLGIMVAVLCYRPPLEGTALILYLIMVNVVFWLLFTFCDIPWVTLGNEITDDFDEKSTLRSISTGFLFLGQLIASGLSLPLVSWISGFASTELQGWQILGAILGILTTLGFLASYFSTKGLDTPATRTEIKLSMVNTVTSCIRVKGFKPLLFMAVFATCCIGIFLSGQVFYLQICFGMSEGQIAVVNITISIASFFSAYVIGWMATRFDKKLVLSAGYLIAAVGLLLLWKMPPTTFSMIATLILFYIGDVAFWTVIFSVLGDVTELESYRSKEDKTGFMSAFLSLAIKVGTATGMWLIGVGLDSINYTDPSVVEGDLAGDFANVFFIPLSIFYFAAFLCMRRYPYSRKAYLAEKSKLIGR